MRKQSERPSTTKRLAGPLFATAACFGVAAATLNACSDGATSADGGVDASAGTDAGRTLGCTATASTQANAAAVYAAANALSAALTPTQQTAIQYSYALAPAQQWSNLPTTFIPRNGVKIGDMSAAAQNAALALVNVATGAAGAKLFSEVRAADEWLVTNGGADASSYGSGRYYFAFIGTPSMTSPWMLQIAGHHLAYNFTYNGACTSATPLFDGVEPTTWTDGTTTHTPLETQRAASVAVIAAISSSPDALLTGTFTDIVNGPANSNMLGDADYPTGITYPTGTTGRGVLVSKLPAASQKLVKTAIAAWVQNAADPVATALLAEYASDAALAATYAAYSGAADLTTENAYFRIDGPRVWLEVTIQHGIVYQNQVHYHTIWRDKASDYGAEFIDSPATGGTSDGGMMGGGPPDGGMMGGRPDGGMMGGPRDGGVLLDASPGN